MTTTTHTDLPTNEPLIVFTRVFDAPRALVFTVWTDPKHIARWWGPFPAATRAEIDLRVGGRFSFTMVSPDGELYPHGGEYLEILPPERLVFSNVSGDRDWSEHGAPPSATVTVTFEERDGKTTATITTLLNSFEERDAMLEMGAKEGWSQSFDKLDAYLKCQLSGLVYPAKE